MAADSRQHTLEAILRWSLRQQDNKQSSTTPMDAEVTQPARAPCLVKQTVCA